MSSYRKPEDLLNKLGITAPEEIDLETIAMFCRARIVAEPLTGCEARLIGNDDRAIITVNTSAIPERRRFSAAHELGHWLRDRGKVTACSEEVIYNRWQDEGKDSEAAANRFAANLLMPSFMFDPRAKNRPITFETVRSLAKVFQTSLTATAIRLVESGSMPGMVLCTGLRGRQWFVRGPIIPEALFPLTRPGRRSIAYDLLGGKQSPNKSIEVEADAWIDHPEARNYAVFEDSLFIAKDVILTVLWWQDESQIMDIDENLEQRVDKD